MRDVSVTSEAYNITSTLTSTSVNNRTGGVEFSISLGQISSGLHQPATFNLILSSHPGNPSQNLFGFGGNWSVNFPRIDIRNQIIYLADGTSVRYRGLDFEMEYHRSKDMGVVVEKISHGNQHYENYTISYKSGFVECYNEFGAITKLISPSGHYLNFDYGKNTSSVYKLIHSVDDGSGNKLVIDYGSSKDNVITVTQLVAGETSITKVYKESSPNTDIIRGISLPNNFDKRFTFEYTGNKNNLLYLSKITTPTGKVEAFRYENIEYDIRNELQQFAVVDQVEIMGNDPERSGYSKILYKYSDNNFSGFPHLNDPQPNRDNCIFRTDDFIYSVTELHSDIAIRRTFNRFHLLVKEELIDSLTGLRQSTDLFTYPIVKNKDIYGQPENYSFWTEKRTVYSNVFDDPRETYETRSFDKYGNLLLHRDASGITTENTYYPARFKNLADCIYTPYGYFVSHLIGFGIMPASNYAGELTKTCEFRYQEIPGLSYYSPMPSMKGKLITPYMFSLVEIRKNGIIVSESKYIGYDGGEITPDQRIFIGMKEFETLPSREGEYTTEYTYSIDDHRAKIHARHIASNMVKVKNTSKTFSLATGLTHTIENFSGAKTEYKYDVENRLISEIKFSGTDSQQVEHYTYEYYKKIDEFYGYQNTVIYTDALGMIFTSYINFNNQLSYAIETFPPSGIPFCVKEIEYFDSGLIASETEYDFVPPPSGNNINVAITTSYSYTARELTKIIHPDGRIGYFKRNKVLNTEEYYERSDVICRKQYDAGGNLTSTVMVTKDGRNQTLVPIEEIFRDGFCRKFYTTNRTNGRSHFQYDQFDRLISEQVYGTDGGFLDDEIRYIYSSDIQNMNLPVSVQSSTSNRELVLASVRSYDGFGRITWQDGIVFDYKEPYHDKPSATYDANELGANSSAVFDAATLLTTQITKLAYDGDKEIRYNYIYNKQTHLITSAHSYRGDLETSKLEYTYDTKGAVTSTTCSYATGEVFKTEKTYTISGARVMTVINHLGHTETYHYNSNGQLWLIKHYELYINIFATYNNDGTYDSIRIHSERFSGSAERAYAILSFGYNEYGVENYRSLEVIKDNKLTLIFETSSVYDKKGLVASRQFRKPSNANDNLDCTFTYLEAYGHLRSSSIKKGTSSPLVTNYSYAGGQRIRSVAATNKNTLTYTYEGDRVSTLTDGGDNQKFAIDRRGNIINGTDKGDKARQFEYGIDNEMTKCDLQGGIYRYMYDPFGRLSQIIKGGKSITYVYDGNTVVGEISGETKTLYLSFGDIVLGRCILRDGHHELEIFGTDSAETVRCVMTNYGLEFGRPGPKIIYHDYSDFGDHQEW
ncbi:hypothetical protein [Pseudomonas koreensis]|uniref:RHS repeat domain-containing protein n=1 Tax=Pseudomonas koreensis TaxID=198620 RepID=UPI00320A7632